MDPQHIVAIQNKKIFQHLSDIRHELNVLSAGTRRFLDELVLAALEVEYPAILLNSAARPGGHNNNNSSSCNSCNSNGRLIQEARFWRWQIAALLARAQEAISKSEQRLVRAAWAVDSTSASNPNPNADADAGRVEREYDRVLEFVDSARTAVRTCKEAVVDNDWNQDRLAAAMNYCEHLSAALLRGFPGVAVPTAPEALRKCAYEPAVVAAEPSSLSSWLRRHLGDVVRRRARHDGRPWGYWAYTSPFLYLAMASCAYWTGWTYLHWPRVMAHGWWFTVH